MDFRVLKGPLKSLALEASSGSFKGIRNLTSYLANSKHALDHTQILPLAHALLSCLSVQRIPPPAATFGYEEAILCAALSLDSITYLSVQAAASKNDPFASLFLRKEKSLWPWLSYFVNENAFFRDVASLDSTTPLNFVPDIFSYLSYLMPIDFTQKTHISEVILEMWITLQAADLSEAALAPLAADTDALVFDVFEQGLQRKPGPLHDFVLRLGGLPCIPELYVASLRKYLGALELQSSADFATLYNLLLNQTINLLFLFDKKLIPLSLLSRDIIYQINLCAKYLFDHCSRAQGIVPLTLAELYSNIILTGPALFPGFYPILDMLELGLAADFRSIQFSEDPHPVVINLTRALFILAKFPGAMPHLEKLISLPRSSSKLWSDWDADIKQLISSWREMREESKQYEGCAVCNRQSSKVKVCSACCVTRYCSTQCQRADCNDDHKWLCEYFRLCGTSHPLLRTNNTRGLFYISWIEKEWGQAHGIGNHPVTREAGHQTVPMDEIPLLAHPLDMHLDEIELKKFKDFPQLFGNKSTRQLVIPRIKEFINIKEIFNYLIVLSLGVDTDKDHKFHILSPSTALIVGNFPSLMQRQITKQMFPDFKWEKKRFP